MRPGHTARLAARIGLLLMLAVGGPGLVTARTILAAQAPPSIMPAVLTTVLPDGRLVGREGDRWSIIVRDIGRGATVTGLAWHPTRPEVLLVRRTFNANDPPEPSYALVYLDLATGQEQTILDGVGPEAEIVGPQIAPDGASGFARPDCCLSREIVRFDLPLTGEPPQQGPAAAFLAPEARDVALVTAGPYTPDGDILMSVDCCMGDEPPVDPGGLYRVAPDISRAEMLAAGITGVPIGLGPGGTWAAVMEPPAPAEDGSADAIPGAGWSLVIVDLPGGTPRLPLGEGGMGLAGIGAVAPDGSIAVPSRSPGGDPWRPYSSLWLFTEDGTLVPAMSTHSGEPGPTAFAWASPDSVADARGAASHTTAPSAQPGAAASVSEIAREVQVFFSRHPESDDDFTAVFPVMRTVGDAGVANAALDELLRGPTPDEMADGYFSEIGSMLVGPSDCGDDDVMLHIEGGRANVRFCRMVRSAGIGQDARARSALEATLLQFPTIQRTRFLTPDGDCLFDMSGENRCLTAP